MIDALIEAITEPYVVFGLSTCLLMIVLMFIADWQDEKKPPKPPE